MQSTQVAGREGINISETSDAEVAREHPQIDRAIEPGIRVACWHISVRSRLVRQFPELLDAVASELHLTGLLMIGPRLTRENRWEVLARAK